MKTKLLLNIANLVLTAIVGIVVAVYINFRNEKLEISLLEMQANIDHQMLESQQINNESLLELQEQMKQKYEMAELEIEQLCHNGRCSGDFKITNIGYAAAEDLTVSVHVSELYDPWKSTINSIDQFDVRILELSLNYSITSQLVNTGGSKEITGNTQSRIEIETLPPQSKVSVVISLNDDVPNQDGENCASPLFYFTAPYFFPLQSIPVQNYIWQKYSIAKLTVSATCDNCSGILSTSDYEVSALTDWGFLEAEYGESDEGYYSATGNFWFDYVYPLEGENYSIEFPEFVLIETHEDGNYSMNESGQ